MMALLLTPRSGLGDERSRAADNLFCVDAGQVQLLESLPLELAVVELGSVLCRCTLDHTYQEIGDPDDTNRFAVCLAPYMM